MVKRRKKNSRKNRIRKGFCKNRVKARKINASTPYETCTEQLSPFGGLLALIKFFDLVNFHKIFDFAYQPTSRKPIEYNSCIYQPGGWKQPCRFVVMRIPKEQKKPSNQPQKCVLFEDDKYTYRIFCTNLAGKAHQVIAKYDKRANVENLVGEAKREGLDMIPSAKFKNNYAFFQIVMLAYNIWRYMKMIAQKSVSGNLAVKGSVLKGVMTNTVRIARLKLLFIAAKVVNHSNRDTIKYSIHDSRTPEMIHLLAFIDNARNRPRPWNEQFIWSPRFAI